MDVILGADGHVGSAVAQTLLAQGWAVTVALRPIRGVTDLATYFAANLLP